MKKMKPLKKAKEKFIQLRLAKKKKLGQRSFNKRFSK